MFPGEIRQAIDGLLAELSGDPRISALGIYGSWIRGDATEASDLDLLVVDDVDDYEFSKTMELDDLILDLNHVPREWVMEPVSPIIDYRLHEMVVLHDPEDYLRRAKQFVKRSFRSPRRIEVRTDGLLNLSDMYLSRAAGALNRRDPETAAVYVQASLIPMGMVLIDIAGVPPTRKAFIWNLRRACARLRMDEVYRSVLSACGLSHLTPDDVNIAQVSFKTAWEDVTNIITEKEDALEGLHEKLKRDLVYLTDMRVMEGISARVKEMIGIHNLAEAAMYLRGWLLPLLEGYAWVLSTIRGEKLDYTSLFRVLKDAEDDIREASLCVFGVQEANEGEASEWLSVSRGLVGGARLDRRRLIETFVT